MTAGLTARQTQILKSVIDEYIKVAEPVGSFALESKYDLGVSSATIRNEMANLTKMGYLRQPHTSAGRVPSPLGMKFYIDQLMEEREMSLVDEVKAKEEVWDKRTNFDDLMEGATQALARKTDSLAVSAIDKGDIWSSGYSNIFQNPEFSDLQVCAHLFELLDETRRVQELLFEKFTGSSAIEVLFGEELGWEFFDPIGIVATKFTAVGRKGAIGVIGPYRLNYPKIIPTVRYFGHLIEEIAEQ